MRFERFLLPLGLLLGPAALAQNTMVPILPGMFGIDTCGAFLCGSPATVPGGSKGVARALEAAFMPRGNRGGMGHAAESLLSVVAPTNDSTVDRLPPSEVGPELVVKADSPDQRTRRDNPNPSAVPASIPLATVPQPASSEPGPA